MGHRDAVGGAGTATPPLVHAPAAAGRPLLDGRMLLKVSSAAAGDAYTLCLGITPPGLGPPLHVHETQDQTHYVLEGTYELIAGPDVVTVGPGACVHMPRLTPHTFRNVGAGVAYLAEFTIPGGIDRYFDAVAHLGALATDLEARNAVGRPYGISFPTGPEDYLEPPPGETRRPVVFVDAGEGRRVTGRDHDEIRLLDAADGGGLHSLSEVVLPAHGTATLPAPGPLALIALDEPFSITVGEESVDVRRHDAVAVAAGGAATATSGGRPSRFIVYALADGV